MKKPNPNSPAMTLVDALKRTKSHCDSIANDAKNHPEIERKAALMISGQLRHWIYDAIDAPDEATGKAVSAKLAKHRLDGLKVSTTRKIEGLIESGGQQDQQLMLKTQLIDDIAKYVKRLKLPAELTARLLAGASAKPNELHVHKAVPETGLQVAN